MRSSSPRSSAVLLLVALVSISCKEAAPIDPIVCEPPDPECTDVTSVTVSSSIDSVVAVGGPMAELTAEARDGSTPVALTFTWSSSDTGVGTVNPTSGASTSLDALSAGTTTITAAQSINAVEGQLQIRAVNADLEGVAGTLTEPFAQALRDALSATPNGTVAGLVTTCEDHITAGNVLAIDACLDDLIAVSGSGTDEVLLTLLDLFFAHAQSLLQLEA